MSKQTERKWRRIAAITAATLTLALGPTMCVAQSQPQAGDGIDRLTVRLSDPSRPGQVKVSLINGGITVKAYEGKDILVEAHNRDQIPVRVEGGMHRLSVGTTGLTADEENNQVNIATESIFRAVDVVLTVPVHTSLSLRTVNDGSISVTGVDGDLDITIVNGGMTLENVSGSTVAHTINGRIVAKFARVNPEKAMAFSSLNGDIDVTFPADLKADLILHSERGDVLSDFDVQIQRSFGQTIVEDSGHSGGKYRVRTDGSVHATINGGGSAIQFTNLNGNIYIRKAGGAH